MPETTAAGPCAQLQEQLAACVANNVSVLFEPKQLELWVDFKRHMHIWKIAQILNYISTDEFTKNEILGRGWLRRIDRPVGRVHEE